MINFGAVDFSERRPEEVMFLLTLSLHCHITEICEPPMSSSLFSVIFLWVLLFLFITTINSPNLYAMWLIYIYHLMLNDKNRLEFPFNSIDSDYNLFNNFQHNLDVTAV